MASALAEGMDSNLSIALLRAFELRRGAHHVRLPLNTQRLVALLALHNRPLQRVLVGGIFWRDDSDDRARANLRTAVWRLRRLDSNLIDATVTHIGLGPGVTVDIHEAMKQAQRLLDPSVECGDPDLVISNLAADLLPDWSDDWLLLERERFRQVRLHALEALCERLTAARRYAAAVEAGVAAVAGEPLRETAHRVLIHAYLAEGNICEAIRQYRSYCRLLKTELSAEPSPMLNELVSSISPVSLTDT